MNFIIYFQNKYETKQVVLIENKSSVSITFKSVAGFIDYSDICLKYIYCISLNNPCSHSTEFRLELIYTLDKNVNKAQEYTIQKHLFSLLNN